MYKKLSLMLKRPSIYEKSEEKFWTDPHISKEMLKFHLDPNTDLASRRPELIEKAIDLITNLASTDKKILDIGCGPGLYTKKLSDIGYDVTGLDFSQNSIKYAKSHDKKSKYIIEDYLKMNFDEEFDMILLIWCDYGALVPTDRKILLEKVYKALKPGGLFLFDVLTINHLNKQEENRIFEICEKGGYWSPNPYIVFSGHYKYKENVIGDRIIVIENEKERIFNLWTAYFTRESLSIELKNANFTIKDCYSGVMNKHYEENSDFLCVLAEK